ncbi:hypothetical protein HPB52_002943 [Rhipicephalus sanguineus]|uniref:Uncharacterized protein n=1 Tax=Rhipicephalus sanguineus TaxID=34632 RepID=A0A9D4QGK0_RHISA|nr:hypothetical protein HPB52_002943 [Rhipicephalus sanguineus]
MLQRLCPPVPPFHPAYPRAWFMQLDACLAVNGVTAQPLMHDILLDALPAELRHLSAASSSSPQPYDDLCAAVLARYGETYHPLPGTHEFRVSPPPTRAVTPGPQPSHDRDLLSPAMSLSSSRPATSAAVPAPDHPPDEVPNVAAALDQSATRCVPSPPSADGPSGMPAICPSAPTSTARDTSEPSDSTTATLQHALKSDTDMAPSAIRSSTVEDSPSSSIDHHHVSTTSTLCASCQERPALTSQSTAAEVRAPNQHLPNLRDAATITEASEDELRGSPMAEQPAHAAPVAKAGILHADLRSSPRVPPNQGASTGTGAVSDPPAEPTPAVFHDIPLPEFLTGDANQQRCTLSAGMLFDTAQASSTAARRAYLPRAVRLITTRIAHGMVLQPRRARVRRLVYPCQHARRNTKLRSALRRHRRLHHYPPTTHVSGQVDQLDTAQVTRSTYRHPRQRCARTGKTHRSSYSSMVARRGFTVPFRIVSRTSPAPALVHPPSTPCAGTSASRAHSRHPVRYRKAQSSRRGTRLGTTPAYFLPVLRPLRFSQSRPPETQWFPIVLYR